MNSPPVADPLAEWRKGIENHDALVTDPDGHRMKLADLAMLAHRRRQVDAVELSDMLELGDAARLWAQLELEHGCHLGLFTEERNAEKAGTQYFVGGKLVRG